MKTICMGMSTEPYTDREPVEILTSDLVKKMMITEKVIEINRVNLVNSLTDFDVVPDESFSGEMYFALKDFSYYSRKLDALDGKSSKSEEYYRNCKDIALGKLDVAIAALKQFCGLDCYLKKEHEQIGIFIKNRDKYLMQSPIRIDEEKDKSKESAAKTNTNRRRGKAL